MVALAVHSPFASSSSLQLVFLKLREPSPSVGSLVACGAGGWVHMWNTSGGGLMGEFNVWDNRRHSPPEAERSLHSVTTMHVNGTETVLYTGNSLGYIQVLAVFVYIHIQNAENLVTY